MINGKGTCESCSEVTSLDRIDGFTSWNGGDDDSPVISQYSSCGESDFERYCSAPSMMGTPSMCSSFGVFQDCGDSELGSVKSFRLGDDASGLENFSLGGKFDGRSEEKKLSSLQEQDCFARSPSLDGKSDTEQENYKVLGQRLVGMKNGLTFHDVADFNAALDEELFGGNDDGRVVSWGSLSQVGAMQSSFEDQSSQKNKNVEFDEHKLEEPGANIYLLMEAEHGTVVEQVDSCLEGTNPEPCLGIDRTEDERCSDEDGASSRYEHSEGEDSMFGCATDDKQKSEVYHNRNTQNPHGSIVNYQNSLHMTPSAAFGSDDWDDFILNTVENTLDLMVPVEHQGREQQCKENEGHAVNSASATNIGGSIIELPNQQEYARCISGHSNEFYSVDKLAHHGTGVPEQQEKVRHAHLPNNQLQGTKEVVELRENVRDWPVRSNVIIGRDGAAGCPQSFSHCNRPLTALDSLTEEVSLEGRLNISHGACNTEHRNANNEVSDVEEIHILENSELDKINLEVDPLSDIRVNQYYSTQMEANENRAVEYLKDSKSKALRSLADIKMQNIEVNELYDEVVHDMEEILLDSDKSPGGRFAQGNSLYQSRVSLPARDGGSAASTSGTDAAYPLTQHPLGIDGIEVVGARQKKGDVSLSERLVGVKEYTVYNIRVWSGDFHWDVEHRYRDFYTLYRRLKSFCTDQSWTLPTPWSFVEKESRKLFGSASPAVISERSALIQECLQSILHLRFTSGLPNALIWFLSPASAVSRNPASDTPVLQSLSPKKGTDAENISLLGKTISLIVQIHPHKSMRQMLELQYYACAGCHNHFDDGKTLMQEFAQTIGWGRPRLCEYSNQLFCSSCHLNETAVLPARVLHLWDFTEYPVSQLAKSYLDSIHDQPMLCVSAVNPFLFSKVPALQNVTNMRRKIGVMLPYVRCPFRRSICRGLGSRRYLLESNDFFALRDLIDLSKGVFAVLPVMVETISKKILKHITEQCLVCCDVGAPCNARQACDDPTSLIFPFQEGEIERCTSCKSVFHKHCFKKAINCPCGMCLKPDDVNRGGTIKGGLGTKVAGTLDLLGSKLSFGSPVEFLSGLFSKARPGIPADSDTVISMGSLPSTSL